MTYTDEYPYLSLLGDLLHRGDRREGRNGATLSLFGKTLRFELQRSGYPAAPIVPLLTTKFVHWKSIVVELLWFLRGDTTLDYLHQHGVTIWDANAPEGGGDLGPIYGYQWRDWPTHDGHYIDQITAVVASLRADPYGRRHLVNAWNVGDLPRMALPPCHVLFQFYVRTSGHLDCQMYQRSADAFLGLPFNIASYGLLTHLVAREVGLKPGRLIIQLGDVHLYENHIEQARTQIQRKPGLFPVLHIADKPGAFDALLARTPDAFTFEDFTLENYRPAPVIKAPVSA